MLSAPMAFGQEDSPEKKEEEPKVVPKAAPEQPKEAAVDSPKGEEIATEETETP